MRTYYNYAHSTSVAYDVKMVRDSSTKSVISDFISCNHNPIFLLMLSFDYISKKLFFANENSLAIMKFAKTTVIARHL